MSHRARDSDQEVRRLAAYRGLGRHTTSEQWRKTEPTWDGMTVETLYFVLRYRGVVQQLSDAICACEWIAVPSDR
jgi:hypothetical protein